jgi:hypothetical protein
LQVTFLDHVLSIEVVIRSVSKEYPLCPTIANSI